MVFGKGRERGWREGDEVIVGNLHQEDRMQKKDANEMAHGMAPVIAGTFRNNILMFSGSTEA